MRLASVSIETLFRFHILALTYLLQLGLGIEGLAGRLTFWILDIVKQWIPLSLFMLALKLFCSLVWRIEGVTGRLVVEIRGFLCTCTYLFLRTCTYFGCCSAFIYLGLWTLGRMFGGIWGGRVIGTGGDWDRRRLGQEETGGARYLEGMAGRVGDWSPEVFACTYFSCGLWLGGIYCFSLFEFKECGIKECGIKDFGEVTEGNMRRAGYRNGGLLGEREFWDGRARK